MSAKPETPRAYGRRLTAERRARGITQEKFADLMGVRVSTVVRWEAGLSLFITERAVVGLEDGRRFLLEHTEVPGAFAGDIAGNS